MKKLHIFYIIIKKSKHLFSDTINFEEVKNTLENYEGKESMMTFAGRITVLYDRMPSLRYLRLHKSVGDFPSDFHLQSPLLEYLYISNKKPPVADARLEVIQGFTRLVELDIR